MFELVSPEGLKESLRASGRRGLALDIDDTLSHTDNHWYDEMLTKFGNPENITRKEVLARYGAFENVPYWQGEEAMAAIDRFMHSNEFQETIPLIEDANHMVARVNEIVPVVAYITARPVSVQEGTRKWLLRHGFPAAPIIFRPLDTEHARKNVWKAEVLDALYPEVAGIIDDHPKLADQLSAREYPGKLYLYDNGDNEKSYANVTSCGSWEDVLGCVRRDFSGNAA